MAAPAAALAVTALLAANAASADYIEDFDDGSAQGWDLTGLWHVTGNSPNGTQALGYVTDETAGTVLNGNFDTGEPNSGTATTPLLTCGTICSLAFDWLDDSEGGSNYDVFSVDVLYGGSTTNILQTSASSTYEAFSADLLPTVGFGNSFQVQFAFDTLDAVANDGAGVRVDDFTFRDGEQPSTSVPEPATLVLLGAGLLGLGVARRRRLR